MTLRQQLDDYSLWRVPDELAVKVLDNLNAKDLYAMSLVSTGALRLARDTYQRRQIEKYKNSLQGNMLWQYIPLLTEENKEEVDGRFFIHYLETLLGTIPPPLRARLSTFSGFINAGFTTPWLQAAPIGHLDLCRRISIDARMFLQNNSIEKIGEDLTTVSQPSTLIDFMKSLHSDKSDFILWGNYAKINKLIQSLALSIKLSWTNNSIDKVHIVADSSFSNYVNGEVLVSYDPYFPDLIMSMIKEAIQLYHLPDKQPPDILKLKNVENTLLSLNEEDLINYITVYYKDDYERGMPKRRAFCEVLEQNYPFLMELLTEKVLFAITEALNVKFLYFSEEDFLPPLVRYVLSNSLLLKKLSQKGLITLLKRLPLEDIDRVLADSNLTPFLTFETLSNWIDSSSHVTYTMHEEDVSHSISRAEKILVNETLLNALDRHQVVSIAKYVRTSADVPLLYNTITFKNRIFRDSHPNRFLVELSHIELNSHAREISKNPQMTNLLSPNEIVDLAQLDRKTCLLILKNKESVARLASKDLLTIIIGNGPEIAACAVEENNLANLEYDDLQKFNLKWRGSSDLSHEIRVKILTADNAAYKKRRAIAAEAARQERIKFQEFLSTLSDSPNNSPRPSAIIEKAKLPVAKYRFEQPTTPPIMKKANKKIDPFNWNKWTPIAICFFLTIVGLALIATGLGSVAGFPLCATVATSLFSWIPVAPFLSSLLIGKIVAVGSFMLGLDKVTDDLVTNRKKEPKKTSTNTYSSSTHSVINHKQLQSHLKIDPLQPAHSIQTTTAPPKTTQLTAIHNTFIPPAADQRAQDAPDLNLAFRK